MRLQQVKLQAIGAAAYASKADFSAGKRLHDLASQWNSCFKEVTSGSGDAKQMSAIREELGAQNWDNMGIFSVHNLN